MSVSAFPHGTVATIGVPYDLSDLSGNYFDVGAITTTYGVEVIFRTDETVDVLRNVGSDFFNEQDPYTNNVANTWVRCTFVSGDTYSSVLNLGVWQQCSTQRTYSFFSTFERFGTYKFELASDSGGSTIRATKNITFDVGEII